MIQIEKTTTPSPTSRCYGLTKVNKNPHTFNIKKSSNNSLTQSNNNHQRRMSVMNSESILASLVGLFLIILVAYKAFIFFKPRSSSLNNSITPRSSPSKNVQSSPFNILPTSVKRQNSWTYLNLRPRKLIFEPTDAINNPLGEEESENTNKKEITAGESQSKI